ncbi:MAG: amidase [Gammaproteobacteria bacterium]|jgi:Asp-tRNA(Asn)/Glu-tRNA(Gln) amidotransferase A subunit family amidase|nr:amidase [Gammaproteobacteria bacterium]
MLRRRFLKSSLAVGVSSSLMGLTGCSNFFSGLPADLTDLSAIDLSLAIQDKHASCVEVMQAYLDRIHTYNPVYNAIISMVDDDDLFNQAFAADQALARGEYQGWMHGMPHAVKDLIPVAGLAYTNGSPIFANQIAQEDQAIVTSMRDAGAIFIGKTNVPEYGFGSQSYNPLFGATSSAYNPDLTAGGSSGGAASGLGTRMLPVADGGDMMGSLRNPGAFNNVIGFRPSANLVDGVASGPRALSTLGPMGRNTEDTIRLLQTISAGPVAEQFTAMNLNDVNIGWMGNMNNYLPMETGVLELCEANLSVLAEAGANIEPTMPRMDMSDLWYSWTTLRHASRDAMLDFYNNPETRMQLKEEVVWEIEQSFLLSESDVARANMIRQNWYRELDRMYATYDILVLPTSQVFPYPVGTPWPQEINGQPMDTYHRWMEVTLYASLGGIPAVNVPVGFDDQGRPMGMQIIGNYGEDQKVLEFALAYEQITDHLSQRPNLVAAI